MTIRALCAVCSQAWTLFVCHGCGASVCRYCLIWCDPIGTGHSYQMCPACQQAARKKEGHKQ